MKKLFLLLIVMMLSCATSFAQGDNNGFVNAGSDNIIVINVPKKLRLKDKIIVSNRSPYHIIQVVVGLYNETGDITSLGSAKNMTPNTSNAEIASYQNNELKLLKGKTIAIKAKGKKNIDSTDSIESLESNEDSITYDFVARVYEYKHDLYIELKAKDNDNTIMNF